MKYIGRNHEYFEVVPINAQNCSVLTKSSENELSLLWFQASGNQVEIDGKRYTFQTNEMVFFTEFHKVNPLHINGLKLLRFNRPFYCILDHDSEVGCKGLLYFGAANLPVIHLIGDDLNVLETTWKMLEIEMKSRDNLQLEMLQMMLKRILILCTRIYKEQVDYTKAMDQVDLIREFNFLVETHFKTKHNVSDYAALLHKAPKTLANVFKKIGEKTPLRYIQERIHLEAQRLLHYSDQTVSEISDELGFNDIQSFSRFFKKQEGISPLEFRNDKIADFSE